MKKICPDCGTEFECNHSSDCWCSDFKITKELSEFLSTRYNDCICKECMIKYMEKQENNFVR